VWGVGANLERFEALVRADEREACAKVCDDAFSSSHAGRVICNNLAAAIRERRGEQMTECKHRWEPSNFAAKWRSPNHYIFECTRCGKSIFATLKEQP
jgi:ribosomal protein S27AE